MSAGGFFTEGYFYSSPRLLFLSIIIKFLKQTSIPHQRSMRLKMKHNATAKFSTLFLAKEFLTCSFFLFLFFIFVAFLLGCASQKQSVAPLPKIEPLLALRIEPVSLAPLSSAKPETPAPAVFSLMAVGDVMPGSWVVAHLDSSGSTYPFSIRKYFR